MRKSRVLVIASSIACLIAAALVSGTWTTSADASTQTTKYVVLAQDGASAKSVADRLEASGAKVVAVNDDIGLITVTSQAGDFRQQARALAGVTGVAADRSIGHSPVRKANPVESHTARLGKVSKKPGGKHTGTRPKTDPLDSQLWGMKMINADKAHAVTLGSRRVRVGIIDTGVQGDHPDLAPNFDKVLSRNFAPDIPAIDGPCESSSCLDPVGQDDGGHGTHVAGTVAAALNGFGLSGVAPKVDLIELKAGQDSGYFFLQPAVDALTYAGDAGIDVVNMSFYIDPWLYNCTGGAPEDSPEQAAEQGVIIEAVQRALDYANDHGVTLVGSTGNNHEDLSKPRTDLSSPDYPAGAAYPRTIDNATCLDLPTEGKHVIGVDALGPSGKKSDYSNYTTDLTSGEVEVSAPGGWFRDGFGTDTFRTNGNQILSTYPLHVLQEDGSVDENGDITEAGEALGVQKQCQGDPAPGTSACGYYAFLQGTSMASPHATGVAALAVTVHGHKTWRGGFGLAPAVVRQLLLGTAIDHACPEGGVQEYLNEGRSAEFTAQCVGTPAHNGFYGHGIVNALGVVQ